MKRIFNLIIILITIIIISATAAGQNTKSRIWGVIMGISKYQNVPSLRYADKDALSFYDFLLSPAGGSADTNNIRILLNEKATSYNFFEAMDNLLDAAKGSDIVYIYFAGHGDIEKKTERQNGFLIGYNAPPNCYAAGGCIGVRYLQDYVETLVSKNKAKVILIIDACRSGKLAGGAEGAEITALALKAEWKGVTKILSCQPGETSLEGDNWGGGAGVFTYFLLKGLKGLADENSNNEVSLMELSYFLDKNVPKETDNRQMPEVVGDKRLDIAKVDKATYLAMLNQPERPLILPENLQSAGFESDLSTINDVSIIKAYEKFKEYIKTENLIAYSDEDVNKETALSIYRSLEGKRKAQPIITTMKRELLAALQNRAQISINNWMNGIQSNSLTFDSTFQELKTAFKIADSTYNQYSQIKFKYLFWSHLEEKDDSNKIKFLEECLKINPKDPSVNLCLGYIYGEKHDNNEALKYYNNAIEAAKNWSWAWNNKGKTLYSLGRTEEASNCFDKALQLKSDNAQAWYNKGLIFGEQEKNEDAIKCFSKAAEIEPDYSDSWFNKGWYLLDAGKYEEAIKCFDKVIEIQPDSVYAWFNKGDALQHIGKYEDALNCYNKAIEIKPDEYKGWNCKGLVFYNLGKFEESIKYYNKALDLNPDYAESWTNKGLALSDLGKYEDALKCYDKALSIKPKLIQAWYNKGIVLYLWGKYKDAIECYNKVIELKPDYIEALYNRACSYSLMKNKEEMLKSLKKAIELNNKYKEMAKKDNDFKEYWDDPDFKKLVE